MFPNVRRLGGMPKMPEFSIQHTVGEPEGRAGA